MKDWLTSRLADGTLMLLAFFVGIIAGAQGAVILNIWRCP